MSEEERKIAYQNGMTLSEEQQLYWDEEDYLEIDKDKEIERLNNVIKHADSWIDRTIEVIKQQPSEDDTWILERLNGIKQCLQSLKGSGKE